MFWIEIIQELYFENTFVKEGHYLSEGIFTTKELRLGFSLSSLLFNIYIEVAWINWNSFLYIYYYLELMFPSLYKKYQSWELKKSKYLVLMNCDR